MPSLILPTNGGALDRYTLSGVPAWTPAVRGWNRTAYAAAHVVADPLSSVDPWLEPAIDWDRTIAYREHLWRLGFGVAELARTDPAIYRRGACVRRVAAWRASAGGEWRRNRSSLTRPVARCGRGYRSL